MGKTLLVLIALNILATLHLHPQAHDAFKTELLSDGWIFNEDGVDTTGRTATVPGTIHSDLLKHGLIPNPYVGLNEYDIKWIEDKNWVYETTFTVDDTDLDHYSDIDLVAEGLDTFAEILINGVSVRKTSNMFIGITLPIREYVHAGDNRLTIRLASPIKAVMPDFTDQGINYPADNDKDERHLSVYARKAPYHYGWDWGPRMVTCGIWRPIKLHYYNNIRIDDTFTTTDSCGAGLALLTNHTTIINNSIKAIDATMTVTYSHEGQEVSHTSSDVTLHNGANQFKNTISISSPQLWMPNGWGKANLYDVVTTLTDHDGHVLARDTYKHGIRQIRLVSHPDSLGRCFYFEVNGLPIFAKGTNYIPQDLTLPDVTKQDYEKMFDAMCESNMNMVRVWGGGTYEDDYFYDLADERGIMVWQDFMFACSTYPATDDFLTNVKAEADYNIKRLRHHPSLVLWCGNNEIAEGIKYWGWSSRYDARTFEKMRKDYDRIFKVLLPMCVLNNDKDRQYIHTSPDSANWGRPSTFGYGDSHYWGLWYGRELFEVTDTIGLRFVSEFGIESFPEMKTIREFAPDMADQNIDSKVMRHRQKSSTGNETILHYINSYYHQPRTFEDFVYLSQLVQGHGISHCIVANRRNRPTCMGSLYWQLNDCWPAISWSAIDYYGNRKALYYHSRDAFAPIIASVFECEDTLQIYTISDCLEMYDNCEIKLSLQDFAGNELTHKSIKCDVKANSSDHVASLPMASILGKHDKTKVAMKVTIDNNGGTIYSGWHYFVRPADLKLPEAKVTISSHLDDNKAILTLTTDSFAKDIYIDVPLLGAVLSDNFFDLQAGETKIIEIDDDRLSDKIIKEIKVKTLTDTY